MHDFEDFMYTGWGKLLAIIGILVVVEFGYNLAATQVIRHGSNPIAVLEQRLEKCEEIPRTQTTFQNAAVEACFNSAWEDLREKVGTYRMTCNIDAEGQFGLTGGSGEIPVIMKPWFYDPGPGFFLSSCRNR